METRLPTMQDLQKMYLIRDFISLVMPMISERDKTKKDAPGTREAHRYCVNMATEVLLPFSFAYDGAIQALLESDEDYEEFDAFDDDSHDFGDDGMPIAPIFLPRWYTSANGIHIMEDNGVVEVLIHSLDGLVFQIWSPQDSMIDIHGKCFVSLGDAMSCAEHHPSIVSKRY